MLIRTVVSWLSRLLGREIVSSGHNGEATPQGGVGVHYIIDLYGCPSELLNDPEYLDRGVLAAAREAALTLINQLSHQFTPYGLTSVALLAESHLSIHTWPEFGFAAVDVFSCGDPARSEGCSSFVADYFQARNFSVRKIVRGNPHVQQAPA